MCRCVDVAALAKHKAWSPSDGVVMGMALTAQTVRSVTMMGTFIVSLRDAGMHFPKLIPSY